MCVACCAGKHTGGTGVGRALYDVIQTGCLPTCPQSVYQQPPDPKKRRGRENNNDNTKNADKDLATRLFGNTAAFPPLGRQDEVCFAGWCICVPYKSCTNTQHLWAAYCCCSALLQRFLQRFFFISAPFAVYFVRKQSHTHVERFKGRVKGLRAFEEGCGTSTGPKCVSRGLVF